MPARDPHLAAAQIIRDAGGTLVGRTRLQKVAYLMQLAGFGDVFDFEYRHYGPFSDDLAAGMEIAQAFELVTEEEHTAEWGGRYSVYRVNGPPTTPGDPQRGAFVTAAKAINAIELELAATAAFLATVENSPDPWAETGRRKPDKVGGNMLERAKLAYDRLRALPTPRALPELSAS